MQYEVLYHAREAWKVGETKAERVERFRLARALATAERYPDCYRGMIISVRSQRDVILGKLPSLRNMADKDHKVIVLDLVPQQRAALASRRRKIVAGREQDVTFDDRHGATTISLLNAFGSIEAAEAAESKAEDHFDVDGRRFIELAAIARSFLAQTVTETGTGNYFAKVTPTQLDRTQSGAPSGQTIIFTAGGLGTADAFIGGYITNVTRSETRAIVSHIDDRAVLEGSLTNWLDTDDLDIFDAWSTIQAAHDQLFTDQGVTQFTANQYIRIFAGTYNENVAVSSGLAPLFGKIALIIEGDPTADRDDIIIAPTTGTPLAVTLSDYGTIRHLKAAPVQVNGSHCVDVGTGAQEWNVEDVHAVGTTLNPIQMDFNGHVDNCLVETDRGNAGTEAIFLTNNGSVTNCTIRETSVSQAGIGIHAGGNPDAVSGCIIAGFGTGVNGGNGRAGSDLRIRNTTIYDCVRAISLPAATSGVDRLELTNTIISECDDVVQVLADAYPQETATFFGANWILRNNIFHNYTNFATDGVAPKTHAEIIAMNRVDAAGDLDATDPLLTDPANGDFSLASGSPAIFAGHGSGVITGINAVAFDPNTPDIGAWSSGVIPTPVVQNPIITAISPNFDGDSFDMTVGQAAGLTVNVYTSPEIPAIFTLEPTTRFGNGDLTITGKTANTLYYVYCVTLDGGTLIGVSNIVSVFITTTDSGGLPAAVDEDPSVLPGVDLLLRDATHDLARDSRDIVLVDGSLLVRQRLSIALQLFKGEWFLDADAGVPWLQEILEKGVAVAVIDAILRDKIVATPGVNRVLTYSSEIDAATRTVSVAFTVDTVYGPVEFEGALI